MDPKSLLLHSLEAISPVDGRHSVYTKKMRDYVSECALFKYRLLVEVEYLISLSEEREDLVIMRKLTKDEKVLLRSLFDNFSMNDAIDMYCIDRVGYNGKPAIEHDVKAVEYWLKEKIANTSLKDVSEMVHFGLTSEDINNLAFNCMISECLKKVYVPGLVKLIDELASIALAYRSTPMMSHTHGQPASPTTFGKEMAVYVDRLRKQLESLTELKLPAKLNGAVGNYNALAFAIPVVRWTEFSRDFIKQFGFESNLLTTQIESHDGLVKLFNIFTSINNIIRGLDTDLWLYISQEYLVQKPKDGEVGSSTMPHKINPWQGEVSEGATRQANAMFTGFAQEAQTTRMQRDLSDHEFQRNMGVAITWSYIAVAHTLEILSRITVDAVKMEDDLDAHPELLAEAIQTVLRKEGVKDPYEQMKNLSRGKKISKGDIVVFIKSLSLPKEIKEKLLALSPRDYIGLAPYLALIAHDGWVQTRKKIAPKISAVLFDLDDTLVVGEKNCAIKRKEDLLKYFSIGLSVEDKKAYMEAHFPDKTAEFLAGRWPKGGLTISDIDKRIKASSASYDDMLTLNSDALRVLEYLKSMEIKMGIVTDRGPLSSARLLEKFGLKDFFSSHIHQKSVENKKPHPEGIIKCLAALEVGPKNAAYVGNEEKDYQAAKSAGVTPIILGGGFVQFGNPREFTIKNLSEIIEIIF